MDTYSLLREVAGSWGLILLVAFFIGAVFWAFRPGSRTTYKDTANIPFRHEYRPADTREAEE